jgi:hypothetical protein
VKNVGVVLLIGAALALASPAMADQIQVGFSGSGYGPYQTGVGGEFTVNDIGGNPPNSWLDLSGYFASVTSNLGGITSFQTFCIEKDEYLYPYGASYEVVLSGGAVHGGVGGPDPDPLSRGTALLYSQFAKGALTGYNYAAGRNLSAAALQEAIWWLEEEITSYTAGNSFIGLVATTFGSDLDARLDAGAGQYGVYALNLIGAAGAPIGVVGQDQLYYRDPGITTTAVPDGGTTIALLGMALCGMAIVSRRFQRA